MAGETMHEEREASGMAREPRTERVRIIGAQRVGDAAGDEPAADDAGEAPPEHAADHDDQFGPEDWGGPEEPSLPHWTEAPTGEVPAVLDRHGADDHPWAALPEPTWREDRSDWEQDERFDPSLLAPEDDHPRPMEGPALEDRQPWSFELEEVDDEDDLFGAWSKAAGPLEAEPGEALGDGAAGGEPTDLPWLDEDQVPAPGWDPDAVAGEKTTVMDAVVPPAAERLTGTPAGRSGSRTHAAEGSEDEAEGADALAADLAERGLRLRGRLGRRRPSPIRARHSRAHEGVDELDDVDELDVATTGADDRQDGPVGGVDGAVLGGLEALSARPAPLERGGAEAADEVPTATPGLHPEREAPPGRRRDPLGTPGGRHRAMSDLPHGGDPGRPSAGVPRTNGRPSAGRREAQPAGAGRLGAATAGAVSERAGRNIPAAVASGLVVGALALIAFHFGTVPSMVVVTAVVTVAAMEAFTAFRRGGYHPATLLGLVAVVSVMVGTYTKGQQALPLVLVLLVAFTLLWHLAGVDRRAEPVRSTAATLLVFCWVGVFGSFAALLLAPSLFPDRHGIAYLLGAVIAAVAYDVGALAFGAWLGRHPLSPASPGKTWEGLLGGTVAAIVLAVAVVHLIHPWTVGKAAALGIVVAVVSPIGDLGESLVKRHLGLKDMGRLLPGHGGLLDRIDGLLFVLPATYYLLRAFHLG